MTVATSRSITQRMGSAAALAMLAACAGAPSEPAGSPPPRSPPAPPSSSAPRAAPAPAPEAPRPAPSGSSSAVAEGVLARNEHFILYRPGRGETASSLTQRYLGDGARGWEIAELNGVDELSPGKLVAIPLRPLNPPGVYADGYQTIPILAYHRLGDKGSKMVVTPGAFNAQMKHLADNGYQVVRLADLGDFLSGSRALPRRTVVLTFDDGYASTYEHAFPVLKRYGFPATVFVYTDFVGAKDALTWAQMQDMVSSGLIEIQSHSKSHDSLVTVLPGESDSAYRARLDKEVTASKDLLQRKLSVGISSFAYPYGDTSAVVIERLAKADYRLAATVSPGGNPFFAAPLLLQRTMIFGDHDIGAFKARLQTFRETDLR